jgi:hypothetical protein
MPTKAELEQENTLLKARVGDLERRVRTLQNGSKHKADTLASPKGIFSAAVLLAVIIILAHVISVYVGLPGLPTGSVAKMFVIFLLLFLISFPLFSALFFGIRINMKAKLSHFFTPAAEVSTADVSEARTLRKGP